MTVDRIVAAWDDIRAGLPGRAKSRFSGGRFLAADDAAVVFGLPNAIHRDRCQECVGDVEAALSTHFGAALRLDLVVDGDAPPPPARAAEPAPRAASPGAGGDLEQSDDEVVDLEALTDADADAAGGVDLLAEAFPGAELVDSEND